MFDVNLGEFSIIALIAIIVIGPKRLPLYAAQIGKWVREGRKMALGLRDQVREELGPEFEEVDWRKLDPRQYDPRRIIREALSEALDDEPTPAPAAERPESSGVTSSGATAAASLVKDGAASPGVPAQSTGPDSGPRAGESNGHRAPAAPVIPFDVEAT